MKNRCSWYIPRVNRNCDAKYIEECCFAHKRTSKNQQCRNLCEVCNKFTRSTVGVCIKCGGISIQKKKSYPEKVMSSKPTEL